MSLGMDGLDAATLLDLLVSHGYGPQQRIQNVVRAPQAHVPASIPMRSASLGMLPTGVGDDSLPTDASMPDSADGPPPAFDPASNPQVPGLTLDPKTGMYAPILRQSAHPGWEAAAAGARQALAGASFTSPYAGAGANLIGGLLGGVLQGGSGVLAGQAATRQAENDAATKQANELNTETTKNIHAQEMARLRWPQKKPITPADEGVLSDAVKKGIITKGAADYWRKNGWTDAERSSLLAKGVPGASAAVTISGGPQLTDPAIKQAAERYRKTGILPSGMGPSAVAMRTRIMNEAANQDATGDLALNAADYKANQASLQQIQKMLDASTAFSRTAAKNIDVLSPVLQHLSDTGSPLLNRPLRWALENAAGDPTVKQFQTSLAIIRPEFSRILNNPNMVGEYTLAQQKEMEHVLDGSATLQQVYDTLDTLERDAANKRASYQQQVDDIKGRIHAGTQQTPGAPVAPKGDLGMVKKSPLDAFVRH